MGVMKEWICFGHGPFESEEAVCPKGCTLVERAFRTPVGVVGERSRNIDNTLNMIAGSYGLSDMNNDGGRGAARVVSSATKRGMVDAEAYNGMLRKRFGAKSLVPTRDGVGAWGGVGPGGVYRAQGGGVVEEGRGPGAGASTAAIGAPSENRLAEIAPQLEKPRVIATRHRGGDKDLPKVA